ncbi:MAG: enoyl-CoA hydratase-related protein [Thermoleophilaceae bacterium]
MIGAINGWALAGGLETALACDIRIASERAMFGSFEARRGYRVRGPGPGRDPGAAGALLREDRPRPGGEPRHGAVGARRARRPAGPSSWVGPTSDPARRPGASERRKTRRSRAK